MDPDVLYDEIATRVNYLIANSDDHVAVGNLIDDLITLDEWLRKGGFFPQAWQRPERPVTGKPMCTRCFRREGSAHAMWCGA